MRNRGLRRLGPRLGVSRRPPGLIAFGTKVIRFTRKKRTPGDPAYVKNGGTKEAWLLRKPAQVSARLAAAPAGRPARFKTLARDQNAAE